MTISQLIDILKVVQAKHGDIDVIKDGKEEFEAIQFTSSLNTETKEFEEPRLII
jgi:hypothetical protein